MVDPSLMLNYLKGENVLGVPRTAQFKIAQLFKRQSESVEEIIAK
jgi:hypothetical protein